MLQIDNGTNCNSDSIELYSSRALCRMFFLDAQHFYNRPLSLPLSLCLTKVLFLPLPSLPHFSHSLGPSVTPVAWLIYNFKLRNDLLLFFLVFFSQVSFDSFK